MVCMAVLEEEGCTPPAVLDEESVQPGKQECLSTSTEPFANQIVFLSYSTAPFSVPSQDAAQRAAILSNKDPPEAFKI